jgi:hypothetical protein
MLLVLASVVPVSAQQTGSESPRADLSAGAAVWREDDRRFDGFQVTGGYRPWRYVSFIGDFVAYGGGRNTLMGGVRAQGTGRIAPFVQVLYGSAPLDDIAIQPGAGVDFRFARHGAIRGAFDYKISGDDGSTYVGYRLSIGLVLLLRR